MDQIQGMDQELGPRTWTMNYGPRTKTSENYAVLPSRPSPVLTSWLRQNCNLAASSNLHMSSQKAGKSPGSHLVQRFCVQLSTEGWDCADLKTITKAMIRIREMSIILQSCTNIINHKTWNRVWKSKDCTVSQGPIYSVVPLSETTIFYFFFN